MADPVPLDPPLEGRCLCGAVTVSLREAKPGIEACHCDMCRRWTGGTFFSLHGVAPEAFTLSGEDAVNRYASSDWAERASCARCGSALWYSFQPAGTFSFMAGLFDLPASWPLDEQIFIDEMPPHNALAVDTPKKTGAEVIAEARAAGFSFD